ncbi:MAG: hypothetical protein CL849_03645 [Crocinitomicaceae bacterium]|nr:hypothetical protein [Crocinitomicaceae bacterium]
MRPPLFLSFVSALFYLAGCKTVKDPPSVQWLRPTDSPVWSTDSNVPLRFTYTDPAPKRGRQGLATWRVDIGPENESGANAPTIWWSATGETPTQLAVEGLDVIDTVDLTWTVPDLNSGPPNSTALQLTVSVWDSEGVRAADFTTAEIQRPPLESIGIAYVANNAPETVLWISALSQQDASIVTTSTEPVLSVMHFDGKERILVGHPNHVEAWSAPTASTSAFIWARTAPFGPQSGGLQFLRRAGHAQSTSALIAVGWADRIEWINGDGHVQQSWLLLDEETLIDAAVINGNMCILARTNSGELRMIQCNLEQSARMNAITWTPEAPGSLGPNGEAWLIQLEGDPTTIEADGTARRWYTEPNGQTGLNTQPILGSGGVSEAGIFELGGSWVSREQWHWIPSNGEPFTAQPFPAGPIAQDRAQSTMWVNFAFPAPEWSAISTSNGALIPAMSIPLGGAGTAICVAHNRPGTP